jgi:hypothetical protein
MLVVVSKIFMLCESNFKILSLIFDGVEGFLNLIIRDYF